MRSFRDATQHTTNDLLKNPLFFTKKDPVRGL